jgi:hypothetical protein
MMKPNTPTPEKYLPFRMALDVLNKRFGATDREIACWLWLLESNDEQPALKAFCHAHEFADPPQASLGGLGLTDWPSDEIEIPPYVTALVGMFFRRSEIAEFEPKNRYISFNDLVQRWLPYCGNENLTIATIKSFIRQSRILDFAPGLGFTELSSELTGAPPREWAMFDLSQVEKIEAADFPNKQDILPLPQDEAIESKTSEVSNATPRDWHKPPKTIDEERGCRLLIRENFEVIKQRYGPHPDGRQVLRVISQLRDKDQHEPKLKTVQNKLAELRKEKLIP